MKYMIKTCKVTRLALATVDYKENVRFYARETQ